MGVLDDFLGLAPAAGAGGRGRRASPYPWPAETGAIGTQTALPPANTIPPIGLLPATSGGVADFETAWHRKLLQDERGGAHAVEGADLSEGGNVRSAAEARPSDPAPGDGEASRWPLAWWEANAAFPNMGVGLDPRRYVRPTNPSSFDGYGPTIPMSMPTPTIDPGSGLTLDDLEHAWYVTDGSIDQFARSIFGDSLNEYLAQNHAWFHGADTYEDQLRLLNDRARAFDEAYPDVINGFARTFANSVPLIGPLADKAEAATYAALHGFRDGAYGEELQRQRDLARAYLERYPWLGHVGGTMGEVLGALAVGSVAPGTLSLGLGGTMAPVIDMMATGGLVAGLDSFARGFGHATGDFGDLVGAGLEHLPHDILAGATLGPLFDGVGGWVMDWTGLEDVSDGLLGKVAGQGLLKLFF